MYDRSQGVDTTSATTAHALPLRTPQDLQEALEEDRNALLALGELLKTARLSAFDCETFVKGSSADIVANNVQSGLARLINLCVESQGRIVDSYVAQHKESDAGLLEQAQTLFHMANNGAFRAEAVGGELSEALRLAEVVACRGGDLADKAKALETSIWSNDLFLNPPTAKGKKQTVPTPSQPGKRGAA